MRQSQTALLASISEGLAALRRRRRLRLDSHERWMQQGYAALAWAEADDPIDKSTWGDGPWQTEPDLLNWTDLHTGLPCRIRRNHGGALCGYTGIPDNRAARRKWARQGLRADALEVHGGVTFDCQIGARRWIGFDCSHYRDLAPGMRANLSAVGIAGPFAFFGEVYRDLQYVIAQAEGLAAQLSRWSS